MRLSWYPLLAGLLLLAACSPKQYAGRTLNASALAAHRMVAVLPFEVTENRLRMRDIAYGVSDTTLVTHDAAQQRVQQRWREQHQRETKASAYQLQHSLLVQLVAQQPSGGYSVQFQPVAETNRRLEQAGISYANLPEQSMAELQRVLGVDALLSGQTDLYQPLPAGVGFVARVLFNESVFGPPVIPPDQSTTNLTLHDCRSGQLVWRFDFASTGSASLRPDRLTARLVKAAEPNFPYRRR